MDSCSDNEFEEEHYKRRHEAQRLLHRFPKTPKNLSKMSTSEMREWFQERKKALEESMSPVPDTVALYKKSVPKTSCPHHFSDHGTSISLGDDSGKEGGEEDDEEQDEQDSYTRSHREKNTGGEASWPGDKVTTVLNHSANRCESESVEDLTYKDTMTRKIYPCQMAMELLSKRFYGNLEIMDMECYSGVHSSSSSESEDSEVDTDSDESSEDDEGEVEEHDRDTKTEPETNNENTSKEKAQYGNSTNSAEVEGQRHTKSILQTTNKGAHKDELGDTMEEHCDSKAVLQGNHEDHHRENIEKENTKHGASIEGHRDPNTAQQTTGEYAFNEELERDNVTNSSSVGFNVTDHLAIQNRYEQMFISMTKNQGRAGLGDTEVYSTTLPEYYPHDDSFIPRFPGDRRLTNQQDDQSDLNDARSTPRSDKGELKSITEIVSDTDGCDAVDRESGLTDVRSDQPPLNESSSSSYVNVYDATRPKLPSDNNKQLSHNDYVAPESNSEASSVGSKGKTSLLDLAPCPSKYNLNSCDATAVKSGNSPRQVDQNLNSTKEQTRVVNDVKKVKFKCPEVSRLSNRSTSLMESNGSDSIEQACAESRVASLRKAHLFKSAKSPTSTNESESIASKIRSNRPRTFDHTRVPKSYVPTCRSSKPNDAMSGKKASTKPTNSDQNENKVGFVTGSKLNLGAKNSSAGMQSAKARNKAEQTVRHTASNNHPSKKGGPDSKTGTGTQQMRSTSHRNGQYSIESYRSEILDEFAADVNKNNSRVCESDTCIGNTGTEDAKEHTFNSTTVGHAYGYPTLNTGGYLIDMFFPAEDVKKPDNMQDSGAFSSIHVGQSWANYNSNNNATSLDSECFQSNFVLSSSFPAEEASESDRDAIFFDEDDAKFLPFAVKHQSDTISRDRPSCDLPGKTAEVPKSLGACTDSGEEGTVAEKKRSSRKVKRKKPHQKGEVNGDSDSDFDSKSFSYNTLKIQAKNRARQGLLPMDAGVYDAFSKEHINTQEAPNDDLPGHSESKHGDDQEDIDINSNTIHRSVLPTQCSMNGFHDTSEAQAPEESPKPIVCKRRSRIPVSLKRRGMINKIVTLGVSSPHSPGLPNETKETNHSNCPAAYQNDDDRIASLSEEKEKEEGSPKVRCSPKETSTKGSGMEKPKCAKVLHPPSNKTKTNNGKRNSHGNNIESINQVNSKKFKHIQSRYTRANLNKPKTADMVHNVVKNSGLKESASPKCNTSYVLTAAKTDNEISTSENLLAGCELVNCSASFTDSTSGLNVNGHEKASHLNEPVTMDTPYKKGSILLSTIANEMKHSLTCNNRVSPGLDSRTFIDSHKTNNAMGMIYSPCHPSYAQNPYSPMTYEEEDAQSDKTSQSKDWKATIRGDRETFVEANSEAGDCLQQEEGATTISCEKEPEEQVFGIDEDQPNIGYDPANTNILVEEDSSAYQGSDSEYKDNSPSQPAVCLDNDTFLASKQILHVNFATDMSIESSNSIMCLSLIHEKAAAKLAGSDMEEHCKPNSSEHDLGAENFEEANNMGLKQIPGRQNTSCDPDCNVPPVSQDVEEDYDIPFCNVHNDIDNPLEDSYRHAFKRVSQNYGDKDILLGKNETTHLNKVISFMHPVASKTSPDFAKQPPERSSWGVHTSFDGTTSSNCTPTTESTQPLPQNSGDAGLQGTVEDVVNYEDVLIDQECDTHNKVPISSTDEKAIADVDIDKSLVPLCYKTDLRGDDKSNATNAIYSVTKPRKGSITFGYSAIGQDEVISAAAEVLLSTVRGSDCDEGEQGEDVFYFCADEVQGTPDHNEEVNVSTRSPTIEPENESQFDVDEQITHELREEKPPKLESESEKPDVYETIEIQALDYKSEDGLEHQRTFETSCSVHNSPRGPDCQPPVDINACASRSSPLELISPGYEDAPMLSLENPPCSMVEDSFQKSEDSSGCLQNRSHSHSLSPTLVDTSCGGDVVNNLSSKKQCSSGPNEGLSTNAATAEKWTCASATEAQHPAGLLNEAPSLTATPSGRAIASRSNGKSTYDEGGSKSLPLLYSPLPPRSESLKENDDTLRNSGNKSEKRQLSYPKTKSKKHKVETGCNSGACNKRQKSSGVSRRRMDNRDVHVPPLDLLQVQGVTPATTRKGRKQPSKRNTSEQPGLPPLSARQHGRPHKSVMKRHY